MINKTAVTDFFLWGFSRIQELRILLIVMFFSIYLAALTGNVLLILIVAQNPHLHNPMYFFLVNLSFIDACYISTTVPKSMVNSLSNSHLISFSGCIFQVFLVVVLAGAELSFLTVMAYDRYVAICQPLQYRTIMNWKVCFLISVAAWVSNITNAVIQSTITLNLDFCHSNIIEQFFCDVPQLLRISCTDTKAYESLNFVTGLGVGSFCFLFVLISYGYILSAVFKIHSIQGRHKAFSTCTPHLTLFCVFTFTTMFSYMRPKALSSLPMDLLAAILYTVLPPLINPIIYSLRNKEIKKALWNMSIRRFGSHVITSQAFI